MAGKGTRHRFELSRLEIAGVLVSATAGLFVVFLLGMYAGRGLAERPTESGQQVVRMAVAPAVEQTPGAEDGLTFYDTLEHGGRAGRGEAREGHANPDRMAPPGEDTMPAKPAEMVPPKVVESGSKGPEQAGNAPDHAPKAAEAVRNAAEPVPSPNKLEAGAKTELAAAQRKEIAAQPTPAALAKAEHVPVPPATARVAVALAPAVAPTPATRTGAKGDWSVQVSATRDPRTADDVLRRLKGKGYDAFVLKVRRRGETFYRVRVGHYASLEEAQQVVTRLRREPGVPEAFVASD